MAAAARPAGGESIKHAPVEIRKGFARKVYGILSVQLILTLLIAAPIVKASQGQDMEEWKQRNGWLVSVSLVGMVASLCAMLCCAKRLRTFPTNYGFLFLLTSAESLLVGYVSALYTWQSVLLATALTVSIFISMTVFAWVTGMDFTGFGPYVLAALTTMMLFGLAISLLNMLGVPINLALMFYNFCGVLLFTFYIVYDTQMILGEWGGHKRQFGVDDYCFAALILYLDIIQLFLHILELAGDRK